jgi:hypothetical protein
MTERSDVKFEIGHVLFIDIVERLRATPFRNGFVQTSVSEHSGSLHGIIARPIFRPLHSDPRFAALLKRIGLDPAKALVSPNKP